MWVFKRNDAGFVSLAFKSNHAVVEFNELGHLTKLYNLKGIDELKSSFVEPFENSVSRKLIFEDYVEYVTLLKTIIPNEIIQWINGSFVTLKTNPRDIDLVTFVDFSTYKKHESLFEELQKWRFDPKRKVDGYFIKTYPKNHSNHKFYKFDEIEWRFLFREVKQSKIKKDFVELTL